MSEKLGLDARSCRKEWEWKVWRKSILNNRGYVTKEFINKLQFKAEKNIFGPPSWHFHKLRRAWRRETAKLCQTSQPKIERLFHYYSVLALLRIPSRNLRLFSLQHSLLGQRILNIAINVLHQGLFASWRLKPRGRQSKYYHDAICEQFLIIPLCCSFNFALGTSRYKLNRSGRKYYHLWTLGGPWQVFTGLMSLFCLENSPLPFIPKLRSTETIRGGERCDVNYKLGKNEVQLC